MNPPNALVMTEISKSTRIKESVAESAVNETGFGKYNLQIMGICGLIYMNIGFGMGSIGLVIPSAACDFKMSTIDKSRLGVSSALGMLCGAYFWGCTADVKGRKFALLSALFLHGGFDCLSAVTSNYWLFILTKFFSGLGLSGQLALIFAYLGEFQPTNVRDRILTWMEIAWVVGFTLVPIIAWVVIPMTFEYRTEYFSFRSWNLFMLICSLPAVLIGICLLFFPETPKYLAESGQYAELLKVLEKMYSTNNGLPITAYTEKIAKMGDCTLDELIHLARMGDVEEKKERRSIREMALVFWRQTVMILKPPFLTRTLLLSTVMTCLMSTYFPLVVWLPEVFNRFAAFEALYPGESASTDEPVDCEIGMKDDVYLHTVILGLSCVPTALWLPLFVERLGYVFHLVFGSFLCAAVILGLFFVTSSVQNLILACVFEAVASICITSLLCMLVELYPTNVRVMAASFTTFVGRVGSFASNGLFGYLIDDYCVPLIFIIVAELVLGGVLSLFIPRKSKHQQQ